MSWAESKWSSVEIWTSKRNTKTMKATTQKQKLQDNNNALVGKYFHSLNGKGKVQWQGYVIGATEPGWYLVQLFNWINGDKSNQKLVLFSDMLNWLFYEDGDSMVYSYEYGTARPGTPYHDKEEY